MSFANKAHGKLTEARNALIDRRKQTNDADEKAAIDDAISSVNDIVLFINQAALLDAAEGVVDATIGLERVASSARLGPFDSYLQDLEEILKGIADLLKDGEVGERLEPALEPAQAPPAEVPPTETPPAEVPPTEAPPAETPSVEVPPAEGVIPPAVSEIELPSIGSGRKFPDLSTEYEAWFEALSVRPEYSGKVDWHVNQLLRHKERYRKAGQSVGSVPWAMVGVIHVMECGFNFTGHLHNGDPLTSRTRHVPANRPGSGQPPFSWEESAVDALTGEGFHNVNDWSHPRMLYLLEKYNGFGYRYKGLPTPYLWSFSNLYEKGKYVADGHFDPEAVSKQCGAAVMLKALIERGIALS